MASVPVSGSNGLGSRPGRGHCLLFNLVLDAFQLSVVKPKQSDNGQVTTTKNNFRESISTQDKCTCTCAECRKTGPQIDFPADWISLVVWASFFEPITARQLEK